MARQSNYSWKKPWAFADLASMRRSVTSSEIYRRLGILERHSQFEKPYYFDDHQHNQFIYQGPGFSYQPYRMPTDGSYPFPAGKSPRGCKEMACLGGIIECGGCEPILYICAYPPITCRIVSDPTGAAQIYQMGDINAPEAVNAITPLVCLPEVNIPNAAYYEIEIECCGAAGEYEEGGANCCRAFVYPVGCPDACCEEFVLSGPDTVNPNATWTGVLVPACETFGISCGVVSNEECEGLSCLMNGTKSVSVSVPADACGSFTVTVTIPAIPAQNCPQRVSTKTVRINNTGQGGEWVLESSCEDDEGSGQCGIGGGCNYLCTYGNYRIGNSVSSIGQGWQHRVCVCCGCNTPTCDRPSQILGGWPGCGTACSPPSMCTGSCTCGMGCWEGVACFHGYGIWKWECEC